MHDKWQVTPNITIDLGLRHENFVPRTGLSYRMTETSVLRAGYGISSIPFPDNSYAFNFPVKQNNDFNAPNTFAAAPVRMADGFPAPILADIPASCPLGRTAAGCRVVSGAGFLAGWQVSGIFTAQSRNGSSSRAT